MGEIGKVGSAVPAVASAALFSLAELPVASTARTAQLLTAAALLAALAAVHTHTFLSKGLSGWRWYQPFRGGPCFIVLQACGWTSIALVGVGVLHLLCRSVPAPGFASTLGVAQLTAQIALVASLTHFEDVCVPFEYWKQQAKLWTHEGMPVAVAAIILVTATVPTVGFAIVAPPSQQAVGWCILVVTSLVQAAGLRTMWTITWNMFALCAYLLESEEAMCAMACMGIGSICAPWYIGRTVFWTTDFPTRAMIGLSQWASDNALVPLGMRGLYMHERWLGWIRIAFMQLDTALHVLPAALLLQHCARSITPMHVVYSIMISMFWGCTLSLRYMVIDWHLLWQGKLLWKPWGCSSMYEPNKMGHIYMFENSLVPQDNALLKCCPGFIAIVILGHVVTALVAAHPAGGEAFFLFGGGQIVSKSFLANSIGCLIVSGLVTITVPFTKLVLWRNEVREQKKE